MEDEQEKPRHLTCSTCPYYDGMSCHYNAPSCRAVDDVPRAVWPVVGESDWCGAHPAAHAMEQIATNAPMAAKYQSIMDEMLTRIGK